MAIDGIPSDLRCVAKEEVREQCGSVFNALPTAIGAQIDAVIRFRGFGAQRQEYLPRNQNRCDRRKIQPGEIGRQRQPLQRLPVSLGGQRVGQGVALLQFPAQHLSGNRPPPDFPRKSQNDGFYGVARGKLGQFPGRPSSNLLKGGKCAAFKGERAIELFKTAEIAVDQYFVDARFTGNGVNAKAAASTAGE